MANEITVKLKRGGWEVEISCSEVQLKGAVENVLSSLVEREEAITSKRVQESNVQGGKVTCRDMITRLWSESWLAQTRTLSEVHEEISRRGYHYDRTAVSHSLTDLVRENILTRQGNAKSYVYVQKRPFNQTLSLTKETVQNEPDVVSDNSTVDSKLVS